MSEEQRRIGKIWVKGIDYKTDKVFAEQPYIGVNRINVFVGRNNSGKSRFVRGIFSTDFDKNLLNDCVASPDAIDFVNALLRVYSENPSEEIISANKISELKSFRYGVVDVVSDMHEMLMATSMNKIQGMRSYGNPQSNKLLRALRPIFEIFDYNYKKLRLDRFYIPSLRGMRLLSEGAEDPYLKKLLMIIFQVRPMAW